ncbi:MAG: lipoyl(octanoyl) transferase LipB [Gammaproteobacteria bacterium]|nr:lipoyl(octanoyl) transferase LipB [Gammaproteobacteria bacterium]
MSGAAAATDSADILAVRELGRREYEPLWHEMQDYTEQRGPNTPDEIWFAEHPPVFTLGLNASREHVLAPGDIPVVQTDRGGQVTYHGPGQLMIYPLLDLKRAQLGVRDLVTALEMCIVDLAAAHGIEAIPRKDAPGVYVDGRKLASVGLRVRRYSSYHGMALNVNVDVEPFSRINPCGFRQLEITTLRQLGVGGDREAVRREIQPLLLARLGMSKRKVVDYSDGP